MGSSPLARGLQPQRGGPQQVRRIIPARAGFTVEHVLFVGIAMGSSPLARGLRHHVQHPEARPGIIPARAGFTCALDELIEMVPDHPRSRGVYAWVGSLSRPAAGSSPLARGLRLGGVVVEAGSRIIPARAGFTTRPDGSRARRGDHPRSRGVYERFTRMWRARGGSSPLARGLRACTAMLRGA